MNPIASKWPAARLTGPRVSPELALEFIRRTDSAFTYCSTNNHVFADDFNYLLGREDRWAYDAAFREHFGFVDLNYLASHWIASSYIGGPHGPVAPSGVVRLAINFGKWPSVEGVESDLAKVAEAFPWLAFKLSLHDLCDNFEELDEIGPATHSWRLGDGKFEAIEPETLPVETPDVITHFLSSLSGGRRETTWTIDQIERMWGEQIREARRLAQAEATDQ